MTLFSSFRKTCENSGWFVRAFCNSRFPASLRIISFFLSLIFTWNTLAWSAPELDFSALLKKKGLNAASFSDSIRIPDFLGTVESRYLPQNYQQDPYRPFIIHIRDAHAQPEAQRHVEEILELLASERKIQAVALEAAFSTLDPSLLQFFPYPEVDTAVAQRLAGLGELNGAELFALRNRYGVKLQGVEDAELYRRSLEIFRALKSSKEDLREKLLKYSRALENRERKVFSGELANYVLRKRAWEQSKDSALDYFRLLKDLYAKYLKMDLTDPRYQFAWPYATRLMKADEIETSMDRESASAETLNLAEAVNALNSQDARSFAAGLRALASANSGQPFQYWLTAHPFKGIKTSRHFFESFWRLAAERKISLFQYPGFLKLAGLTVLREEIDAPALFEEMEKLEKSLEEKLASTPEEKELFGLERDLSLVRKLLALQMTREDYGLYKKRSGELEPEAFQKRFSGVVRDSSLPLLPAKLLESADEFYVLSVKRDNTLVENTLKLADGISGKEPRAVVLIAGGFHSQGLSELLKSRHIPHISISPRMTEFEDEGLYEKAMMGSNANLDFLMSHGSALGIQFLMDPPSVYAQIEGGAKQKTILLGGLLGAGIEALREKGIEAKEIYALLQAALSAHPAIFRDVQILFSEGVETEVSGRKLKGDMLYLSAPSLKIEKTFMFRSAGLNEIPVSAVAGEIRSLQQERLEKKTPVARSEVREVPPAIQSVLENNLPAIVLGAAGIMALFLAVWRIFYPVHWFFSKYKKEIFKRRNLDPLYKSLTSVGSPQRLAKGLVPRISHESSEVRKVIVRVIRSRNLVRTFPAVLEQLAREEDPSVAADIVSMLETFGPKRVLDSFNNALWYTLPEMRMDFWNTVLKADAASADKLLQFVRENLEDENLSTDERRDQSTAFAIWALSIAYARLQDDSSRTRFRRLLQKKSAMIPRDEITVHYDGVPPVKLYNRAHDAAQNALKIVARSEMRPGDAGVEKSGEGGWLYEGEKEELIAGFSGSGKIAAERHFLEGVEDIEVTQVLQKPVREAGPVEKDARFFWPHAASALWIMKWLADNKNEVLKDRGDGAALSSLEDWLTGWRNLLARVISNEGERDNAPQFKKGILEVYQYLLETPDEIRQQIDWFGDVLEVTNAIVSDAFLGAVSMGAFTAPDTALSMPDAAYFYRWLTNAQVDLQMSNNLVADIRVNLQLLSEAKKKEIRDLKIGLLIRPRHQAMLTELFKSGVSFASEDIIRDPAGDRLDFARMTKKAKEKGYYQSGNVFLMADGDMMPAFSVATGDLDAVIAAGGPNEVLLGAMIAKIFKLRFKGRLVPAAALAEDIADADIATAVWSKEEREKLLEHNLYPADVTGDEKEAIRKRVAEDPHAFNRWLTEEQRDVTRYVWTEETAVPGNDGVFYAATAKLAPAGNQWLKALKGMEFDAAMGNAAVYEVKAGLSGDVRVFKITFKTVIGSLRNRIQALEFGSEYDARAPREISESDAKQLYALYYEMGRALFHFAQYEDAFNALSGAERYAVTEDEKREIEAAKAHYKGLETLTREKTDANEKALAYFEKAAGYKHRDSEGYAGSEVLRNAVVKAISKSKRSEMRQDPNETLEALEKQLSGKTLGADGIKFRRRSTGTHPAITLMIGKAEGTAESYEISFTPNAPSEFAPNEGWTLSVYSSAVENLGNTRKWSYRLTEKTPSIRPGTGEDFVFRFPEEEYAFLGTVKGIEIINNRLQITVSRDFWDGLQTSPVRDGEGNFMVRKVAEHGILVPAARKDIPSAEAARRKFLKGFKPYYQFLSEGDDFSVEKPHVFHVLGNPDAMTFIRFAQAWKSEYAGTPVVLAGGRGRGTVPLIENILAYYGDRLEASDREKLEGGRTDANVKETDLMRLIFKLEGFTDGDFEKVFDEKQPSKNTEQNFEFSQEKIDELTAGVTNPVIAEVSRPDLLRRVQAQGKKSLAAMIEAKGWQVRRFKVYTEDLDRMPDQDLLKIAAYTAGHPDDYVLKHKTLPSWFDQNELRGYQFLIGIDKKDRDYSAIQNFLPAYSLYLDALGAVPDDSGTQLMVRSEMRPQPLDERFEMERASVEASLTAVRDQARLERNRDVMDLMQLHLDAIAREPNAGSLIAAKEEIAKHLDILARVKRSEVRKVPAHTIVTDSSTQPWYDIQNLQETLRAELAHVKAITVFGKKLSIGQKERDAVVGQFYNMIRANAPRGKAHNGFLFRAEWEWSEALGGLTLKVLPLPVPMPYALKSIQDLLTVNYTEIDRIIEAFMADMDKGLAGQPSSLSMIPAYVRPPTGKEEGEFMALDLGGTNFRVLTLKLQGGEYSKPVIQRFRMKDKKIYTTTGDALFDFIAESVAQFMKAKRIPADRKIRLGFTFSFAVNQTGMASGKLDRWSKEFKATGVIGQDVVELLNNAFARKGIKNVEIAALVNDTVGTLATATFEDSNTSLGVILGTGTNAAVWMRIADIRKWRGEQKAGLMAVNMEWGNFNKLKMTRFDKRLHQAFGAKPGEVRKQTLEKMVSGKYLGEVFRQVLIELIPGGKLFEGTSAVPAKISKVESLETAWMSRIAADRSSGLTGVAAVLKKMGIEKSTLEERRTVQQIASWVAARSARISAAVIAASLIKVDPQGKNLSREHTVAVDGSVYEFYPGYQEEIRRVFNVVFGPETARKIKLVLTRDGSGVGAAVIAASAGKSSRSEMRNVITLEPITLQGPVSLFDLMRARIPELADATRPDDVVQFWKAHELKATIEFTSSRIPLQPGDLKGTIGAKGGTIRIQYTLVRPYEAEDAGIIKTGVGTELARSLQKFLATPQPRARLAAETVVAREITEAQPAGPDELAQLLKRVSLDVVYRRDKASVEAGKDGLAFRINRMTPSGMSMAGQPGFSKGVKGAVSTDLEIRRKQFLLLLFSELLGQDFDLDKKLAEDKDEVAELKIGVNDEIVSIYKRSEQRETPQLFDSALLARLYTSASDFKAAENAIAARLRTEGRDLPSVLAVSQAVTHRWVGVTDLLIPGFIPYAQITFGLAPAGFSPGFVSPAQSNEIRTKFRNAGTSADNEGRRVSAEAPIAPRTVVLVGDTGMTEQDLAAMQLPRGSRIILVDKLGGDADLWNRYSKLRIGDIRARRFSAKGDMPSEQELRSIFGSREQVPVLVLGKNSAEGVLDAYKDAVLHEGFVTTLPESHEARFALSYFLGHGTPELLRKQIPDDLLTIRLRSNALSPTSIPLSAQGRFADWAFAEIKRRTFESAA